MNCKIRQFWGMKLPTAGIFIGFSDIQLYIIFLLFINFSDLDMILNSELYKLLRGYLTTTNYNYWFSGNTYFASNAICLLDILTSVLLIYGTTKQSADMLYPWLIQKCVSLLFELPVLYLTTLIPYLSVPLVLIYLGLNIWTWFAVLSLFEFLRIPGEVVLLKLKTFNMERKESVYV